MIEVRLANSNGELISKSFELEIDEIIGNFCFLYIDDSVSKGYSLVKTNGIKANISKFQLNKDDSKKLFFLKNIGMNLKDFGIEEFYDNDRLVNSFFSNNGKINFSVLFRGLYNDL